MKNLITYQYLFNKFGTNRITLDQSKVYTIYKRYNIYHHILSTFHKSIISIQEQI